MDKIKEGKIRIEKMGIKLKEGERDGCLPYLSKIDSCKHTLNLSEEILYTRVR